MTARRKPGDSPRNRAGDPGVVLFAPPADPDSPIQLDGPEVIVNLDAVAAIDHVRTAVLAKISANIEAGRRPDGGPQRPLSRARAAEPDRASPHRGFRTGLFKDFLQATPIAGNASRAESTIRPPPERVVFARAEARRGVVYVGRSPLLDAVAAIALDEVVRAQLQGLKVDAEQGVPLAKEVTP